VGGRGKKSARERLGILKTDHHGGFLMDKGGESKAGLRKAGGGGGRKSPQRGGDLMVNLKIRKGTSLEGVPKIPAQRKKTIWRYYAMIRQNVWEKRGLPHKSV